MTDEHEHLVLARTDAQCPSCKSLQPSLIIQSNTTTVLVCKTCDFAYDETFIEEEEEGANPFSEEEDSFETNFDGVYITLDENAYERLRNNILKEWSLCSKEDILGLAGQVQSLPLSETDLLEQYKDSPIWTEITEAAPFLFDVSEEDLKLAISMVAFYLIIITEAREGMPLVMFREYLMPYLQ